MFLCLFYFWSSAFPPENSPSMAMVGNCSSEVKGVLGRGGARKMRREEGVIQLAREAWAWTEKSLEDRISEAGPFLTQ